MLRLAEVSPDQVLGGPAGVPLFHQPWWLDAVAPGRWDAAEVTRGGTVVGRLPYVVRGHRRVRVLSQPPLTQFLGPWVAPTPGAKPVTALGDQMELQAALEAALPPAAAFRQNFSPAMIGALPFLWRGYRAEVRYTYRIADLESEDALWDGLAGNIRREIRKARRRLVVRDDLGLDRLQQVWAKTFTRQGLPAPDHARLERIEAACSARDARATLFAVDEDDRVHAVAYLVWDDAVAYYLLGGGDPELRTSGAASLLMWEALLRARKVSATFDFEGSMLAPVERFFRAFGGRQTPYLHVTRATRTAALALAARGAVRRAVRRRGADDGESGVA
jgi:hypothetical protein